MLPNIARAIEEPGPANAVRVGASVERKRRRGVRAEPQLSIVLVAMEELPMSESLRTTLNACEAAGVELVFVQRGPRNSGPVVRRSGHTRTLTAPATATAEELRAAGMATATGDIVTVCELPASGDEPVFTWPLTLAAATRPRG